MVATATDTRVITSHYALGRDQSTITVVLRGEITKDEMDAVLAPCIVRSSDCAIDISQTEENGATITVSTVTVLYYSLAETGNRHVDEDSRDRLNHARYRLLERL